MKEMKREKADLIVRFKLLAHSTSQSTPLRPSVQSRVTPEPTVHNGFGSGARKREGEAKRDLRRDERSDGGEGADDDDTEREDTRGTGHCTGERVRTLGRGSRRPSARSSWGFCAISRFEIRFSSGRVGDGRREVRGRHRNQIWELSREKM